RGLCRGWKHHEHGGGGLPKSHPSAPALEWPTRFVKTSCDSRGHSSPPAMLLRLVHSRFAQRRQPQAVQLQQAAAKGFNGRACPWLMRGSYFTGAGNIALHAKMVKA